MNTTQQPNLSAECYPGNDFYAEEDSDEEIIQVAWKIGAVAKLLSMEIFLVRFYSDLLNLNLGRNSRNERIYRRKDIDRITALMSLIRVGFNAGAAVKFIDRSEEILKLLS